MTAGYYDNFPGGGYPLGNMPLRNARLHCEVPGQTPGFIAEHFTVVTLVLLLLCLFLNNCVCVHLCSFCDFKQVSGPRNSSEKNGLLGLETQSLVLTKSRRPYLCLQKAKKKIRVNVYRSIRPFK